MSVAVFQGALRIARSLQIIAKSRARSQLFPKRIINLVPELRNQKSELRRKNLYHQGFNLFLTV
jgi:hypothetical protein